MKRSDITYLCRRCMKRSDISTCVEDVLILRTCVEDV